MKTTDLDSMVTALTADGLAGAISADGVKILQVFDKGDLRCFVCNGNDEGDFLAFQSGATGQAFIVEKPYIGRSIHDQVRAVLTTSN